MSPSSCFTGLNYPSLSHDLTVAQEVTGRDRFYDLDGDDEAGSDRGERPMPNTAREKVTEDKLIRAAPVFLQKRDTRCLRDATSLTDLAKIHAQSVPRTKEKGVIQAPQDQVSHEMRDCYAESEMDSGYMAFSFDIDATMGKGKAEDPTIDRADAHQRNNEYRTDFEPPWIPKGYGATIPRLRNINPILVLSPCGMLCAHVLSANPYPRPGVASLCTELETKSVHSPCTEDDTLTLNQREATNAIDVNRGRLHQGRSYEFRRYRDRETHYRCVAFTDKASYHIHGCPPTVHSEKCGRYSGYQGPIPSESELQTMKLPTIRDEDYSKSLTGSGDLEKRLLDPTFHENPCKTLRESLSHHTRVQSHSSLIHTTSSAALSSAKIRDSLLVPDARPMMASGRQHLLGAPTEIHTPFLPDERKATEHRLPETTLTHPEKSHADPGLGGRYTTNSSDSSAEEPRVLQSSSVMVPRSVDLPPSLGSFSSELLCYFSIPISTTRMSIDNENTESSAISKRGPCTRDNTPNQREATNMVDAQGEHLHCLPASAVLYMTPLREDYHTGSACGPCEIRTPSSDPSYSTEQFETRDESLLNYPIPPDSSKTTFYSKTLAPNSLPRSSTGLSFEVADNLLTSGTMQLMTTMEKHSPNRMRQQIYYQYDAVSKIDGLEGNGQSFHPQRHRGENEVDLHHQITLRIRRPLHDPCSCSASLRRYADNPRAHVLQRQQKRTWVAASAVARADDSYDPAHMQILAGQERGAESSQTKHTPQISIFSTLKAGNPSRVHSTGVLGELLEGLTPSSVSRYTSRERSRQHVIRSRRPSSAPPLGSSKASLRAVRGRRIAADKIELCFERMSSNTSFGAAALRLLLRILCFLHSQHDQQTATFAPKKRRRAKGGGKHPPMSECRRWM